MKKEYSMYIQKNTYAYPPETTHIAAVVDEPRQISTLGGINDGLMIHPEKIRAANASHLVMLLS